MKLPVIILSGTIFLVSCSSSKLSKSERIRQKGIEKITQALIIKKAVESRQYVIRVDKIYIPGGRMADLVPRNNFIIIDRELATISLGYMGRTFSSRQVSGVNFNGQTVKYIMKSDETKGIYDIEVSVQKNNDRFDLYITVGFSGTCNISLNHPKIQSVSYKGSVVPLSDRELVSSPKPNRL